MQRKGRIRIRGIIQGVGFRPFVYALACRHGIGGSVRNLGSEVEIFAGGDHFEEFLRELYRGTPLSVIDRVEVSDYAGEIPDTFTILESDAGSLTGFIPADIAICDECIDDICKKGGRYKGYWATSCVNCGPRYSIIHDLPYDRKRTSMREFPMCGECRIEYLDAGCRRHHAQTIACGFCGPALDLLDASGRAVECEDPILETAALLDAGAIVAIRGIGGFHIACVEESVDELKRRLERTQQPLAIMVHPDEVRSLCAVSEEEARLLGSRERPIVVLEKKDPYAHTAISNLHTLGCMFPYTGLHHLLFHHLKHPYLVMTSANIPGYPMITEIDHAMSHLHDNVDYFLTHDRVIRNRVDDSVVRDGYIIRLSRGLAPKRNAIDLGDLSILGVGPELNSNVTLYHNGYAITSPHIGHVRNPPTLAYLQETVEKITALVGAKCDVIVHDAHPRFLSTRYARTLAGEYGAELMEVQHHRAHIAAATTEECIGIAIDGVGYGDDGAVWGGEVFAGTVPHLDRVAHLEYVAMPGGDRATIYPERMLFGILPGDRTRELLASRGWDEIELNVLGKQVETGINVARTSSTGRVLDAVAALLDICRHRTYDGEPAMRLESAAHTAAPEEWDLHFGRQGSCEVLLTSALCRQALDCYLGTRDLPLEDARHAVSAIAASFQHNLARGLAKLAIHAAEERGISRVALSGGVAYNHAIRETIRSELEARKLDVIISRDLPLGDGCISFGQCVYGARMIAER